MKDYLGVQKIAGKTLKQESGKEEIYEIFGSRSWIYVKIKSIGSR